VPISLASIVPSLSKSNEKLSVNVPPEAPLTVTS
jgi:hypothetical protein